jgi:haloacetate dehalogenase
MRFKLVIKSVRPAGPFQELLPDFEWKDVTANGVRIRAAIGGKGPPLLLVHGFPQMHLTWYKIAPTLSKRFTVILPDIRGYGDSDKPDGGENHINYSKREMARDLIELTRAFGFTRFSVVSHDRGARITHRMALDFPEALERAVIIDIVPTADSYAATNKEFATSYYHWFFLIQPFDLPEHMIMGDTDYFLSKTLARQIRTDGASDPRVFEEYRRCFSDPALVHAVCEDFRASASIDLQHDAADSTKRVQAPLMILWGKHGIIEQQFDALRLWREKATTVEGRGVDCGHCIQEEKPEELMAELDRFLRIS